MRIFSRIIPGAKVTIVTSQGRRQEGRAVMVFHSRAVLDVGRGSAAPAIATPANVVAVEPAR